jgi:Bacterial TniB protein
MGKTRIVQKFLREHRSSFDDVTGRTRLPVVAVQMAPAPSERDLYEELLVSIGAGPGYYYPGYYYGPAYGYYYHRVYYRPGYYYGGYYRRHHRCHHWEDDDD